MKKFVWASTSLYGERDFGFIEGTAKKHIQKELLERGMFQIHLSLIAENELKFLLPEEKVLKILEPLCMLLDSGILLNEALELLIIEEESNLARYIFLKIRSSLQAGNRLAESFYELRPMFSNFFVSMIGLAEETGKLRHVLQVLKEYYQSQNNRKLEIKKQLQYPKIIFISVISVAIGIIAFIIPMFENLFALYQGELPISTQGIIFISNILRENPFLIFTLLVSSWVWSRLPTMGQFHPWIIARGKMKQFMGSYEDPLLFAEVMKILLESGQNVFEATKMAGSCLSQSNQKQGLMLMDRLKKGYTFGDAFKEITWFPKQFYTFIAPAEKAGKISIGFDQVYHYIKKRREEQYEKWSKLLEPLIMFLLGLLVLWLLMSIYLPVFDLGNQFS